MLAVAENEYLTCQFRDRSLNPTHGSRVVLPMDHFSPHHKWFVGVLVAPFSFESIDMHACFAAVLRCRYSTPFIVVLHRHCPNSLNPNLISFGSCQWNETVLDTATWIRIVNSRCEKWSAWTSVGIFQIEHYGDTESMRGKLTFLIAHTFSPLSPVGLRVFFFLLINAVMKWEDISFQWWICAKHFTCIKRKAKQTKNNNFSIERALMAAFL